MSGERALCALALHMRNQDVDAVGDVLDSLSAVERAEARELFELPGIPERLYDMSDAELRARMLGLAAAGKSLYQRTTPGYETTSIRRMERKVLDGWDRSFEMGWWETLDGSWHWLDSDGVERVASSGPGGRSIPASAVASAAAPERDERALAEAIAAGRAAIAAGYGPQKAVCDLCRSSAPSETKDGRCRHWRSPAEVERRRAWERDPQRLIEQATQAERMGVSGYVRVVTVEQDTALGAALANRGLARR